MALRFHRVLIFLLVTKALSAPGAALSPSSEQAHRQDSSAPELQAAALEHARALMERTRAARYPELQAAQIQLRLFESTSDFFQARPRLPDFFFRKKLRYVIRVNPKAYDLRVPESAVEAIIAHELSHVAYLKQQNRVRLLTMIRLLCRGYARDFERRADLDAISRGYGNGLRVYREWLYQHVSTNNLSKKRRNYFSPDEIDSVLQGLHQCPQLLDSWFKKPPRDIRETQHRPLKICAEQ